MAMCQFQRAEITYVSAKKNKTHRTLLKYRMENIENLQNIARKA